MINFTKEEISLCKQVAERYRKEIKYGDWFLNEGGFVKVWPYRHNCKRIDVIPLWTISDCLEFFEERSYQVEIKRVSDSWFIEIWKIGHKAESIKEWTAKLLESCLKAVLAVLVEGV